MWALSLLCRAAEGLTVPQPAPNSKSPRNDAEQLTPERDNTKSDIVNIANPDSADSNLSAVKDSKCVPPATPALDSAQPNSKPITVTGGDGHRWTMSIDGLRTCSHLDIRLTSDHASDMSNNVDPDAVPLAVFAHLYTAKNLSGIACNDDLSDCTRLSRRLPLRFDTNINAFIARITPDPSSSLYVFELRVRHCAVLVIVCICWSPQLS